MRGPAGRGRKHRLRPANEATFTRLTGTTGRAYRHRLCAEFRRLSGSKNARVLAAVLWTSFGVSGIIPPPTIALPNLCSFRDSMNGFSQTFGLALGGLLVGWVFLQGMMFSVGQVLRRGRRERDYVRARAEFCRRVEVAAQAARATQAIPDWNGWRPFRVAAIVDEAQDVKSFYFTPVDGQPLAPFAPGQYLTFRLDPMPKQTSVVRCYSLSDRPRQDYFRATIKRIAAPPDQSERAARARQQLLSRQRACRRRARCASTGGHVFPRSAGERADRSDRGRHRRDAAGEHAGSDCAHGPTARSAGAVRLSQRGRSSVQGTAGVARGRESESSAACELFGAAQVGRALSRLQPPRPDNARARCGRCCRRTIIGSTCAGRAR